uniref:Ionotropic glutamate receptor C-terminal domain-containing protein n=1 Tax=Romanomermis culicivorax TaxID=13658 RepID=A0A915JCY0_ROMCU
MSKKEAVQALLGGLLGSCPFDSHSKGEISYSLLNLIRNLQHFFLRQLESIIDDVSIARVFGRQGKFLAHLSFSDYESSVPIYQRMWAYMSTEKGVLVKNYEEGIQKVRESKGNYAFLIEATANEYYNTRKPCDTLKVGENLNTLGYGVATKFGSRLRVQVNLIVLELLEKGELKKLENKWWYEKGQCEQGMSDSQSASLTLSKVAGIFYLLIGGMILAMIVALGEFVYRMKMDSRKKNCHPSKELKERNRRKIKVALKPELAYFLLY